MPLYTKLPESVKEVDVIVAGGSAPLLYNAMVKFTNEAFRWFDGMRGCWKTC